MLGQKNMLFLQVQITQYLLTFQNILEICYPMYRHLRLFYL